jgi:hypothetical protein
MLGKHVASDLELKTITVPTQLSWGDKQFQDTLHAPTSDIAQLKRRQLTLFALRHKDATDVCRTIRDHISNLQSATAVVDELEAPLDPRIQESIEQIYWSTTSFGAKLNDKPPVVSTLVFWKTLVLPTLAVVVPLLALIVPFFLIRYLHDVELSASDYIEHMRKTVLKQITVPDILRAKHDGDIVGKLLETGFLGLTAVTYISGIWSQVTAARHLRTIALGLRDKGDAIAALLGGFVGILDSLQTLPDRLKAALRPFLLRGEKIRADIAEIPADGGYRTYGYLWNQRTALGDLKAWIGELDAMLGIVGIAEICFPKYQGGLVIEDVYHPSLATSADATRITNIVSWDKRRHAILTGPNRGGKSTLCRAIGVSLLCAQSWGFAFASRMTLTPFECIETALHPADTLGEMSLFEAEIEFAKTVLAKKGRMFVMMDEIFHSTNARDGLAASQVFLKQLYCTRSATSLISTHYKELPTEFGGDVLAWAMEAKEGSDGWLEYTYKKMDGISDKSSVMEILRERGLLL